MSDISVEFGDEGSEKEDAMFANRKTGKEESAFSPIHLLKKFHLVKTNEQGELVLLFVSMVIFFIALMIILYYNFGVGKQTKVKYYIPQTYQQQLPQNFQNSSNASIITTP